MKRKLVSVLAIALLVSGCSFARSPSASTTEAVEVVPGKRVGPVALGSTKWTVLTSLGAPHARSDDSIWFYGWKDRNFESYEVAIFWGSYPLESVRGVQWFRPAALGVIRTGSSRDLVVQTLGEPQTVVVWQKRNYSTQYVALIWISKGIGIVLHPNSMTVAGFIVFEPLPFYDGGK